MSLPKDKDPFFGLKYIAYCRTGLPVNKEDVDAEAIVNFAKWQICKTRSVLWNDPVWDRYTPEEIMAEYFAIKFDDDAELRTSFENSIISVKHDDLDWMERMERKYAAQAAQESEKGKIKEEGEVRVNIGEVPEPEQDYEDTF